MSSPSTPNRGILGRMIGSISRYVSTPTAVSNENKAPRSNVTNFNGATPRVNPQGRPVLIPRKPRQWDGESPPHTPIQTNSRAILAPRQPRAAPQTEPRKNRHSDSPPDAPGHWPKTEQQLVKAQSVESQEQSTPKQLNTRPKRFAASEARRKSKWNQGPQKTPLEKAQENWVKYQELMMRQPTPSPENYRPVHSVKNFEGEMPPSALKMKRPASPMKFTPIKKVKFNPNAELKMISPTIHRERTLADSSPRKRGRASDDYEGGEFDNESDRPHKRQNQNMFGPPPVPKPGDKFQVPPRMTSESSITESEMSSATKRNTLRNRFISPPEPSPASVSSSKTPQPAKFVPSREHPTPGMFCVPDYSDDDLSTLSNVDTSMLDATVLSNQSPPPSVASHIATPGLSLPAQPVFAQPNMFRVPDYSITDSSSGRDPTPTPGVAAVPKPADATTVPSAPISKPSVPSSTSAFSVSANTPKANGSASASMLSNTPKPSVSSAASTPKPSLLPQTTSNLFAASSGSASTSKAASTPSLFASASKPLSKPASTSTNLFSSALANASASASASKPACTSTPSTVSKLSSPTKTLFKPQSPTKPTFPSTTKSNASSSTALTTTTTTLTFPHIEPHRASPAVLAALSARSAILGQEEAAYAKQAWDYGYGNFLVERGLAQQQGREVVYLI